jgi:lysophospholipase L1-like esterase
MERLRKLALVLGIAAVTGMLLLAACGRNAAQAGAPVHTTTEPTAPQSATGFDIGSPVLDELWVDPLHGADDNGGADRGDALATIGEAWRRIPTSITLTTGVRINLVAGVYPESSVPVYWEDRHGTWDAPVIVRAADGPRSAVITASLNVFHVDYFYLIDLAIRNNGDVFHCEQCDHVLIRNSELDGGDRAAHETVKVNQSQYFYLEGNDIRGADDNTVDFVAVQYGHLLRNRISNANDWCAYVKGGSAYLLVEGNEFFACGTGGFTVGQGTGFEYMVSPWLHYEGYDVRVVNNVVHDVEGAAFGVNGGYRVLIAHNTAYHIGERSHLLEVVFGGRSCDGDDGGCAANHALGGWGPAATQHDGEPIPNRSVYIYNNLLANPAGYQSRWQQVALYGPRTPAAGMNIPTPATVDGDLRIAGNIIWNGPADHALGLGADSACQPANPTCNETQLRAQNAFNSSRPLLADPAGGDFRPTNGTELPAPFPIPTFPAWLNLAPVVPAGNQPVAVANDFNGAGRAGADWVGAFAATGAAPVTPTGTPAPLATPTSLAGGIVYLPAVHGRPTATPVPTNTPTNTPTSEPTGAPTPGPTPPGGALLAGPVTMVALGDSLTEGSGDDSGIGYPGRLLPQVQALRSASSLHNFGKSGWTSADLIHGVNGDPGQLGESVSTLTGTTGAKVAFVWIGSNDLWYLYEYNNPSASDELADVQAYRRNLATILGQLTAAGAQVFIGLCDDQSQRPVVADPPNPAEPAFTGISESERLAMSAQVDRYNDAIRAVAAEHGAVVVDFFATTLFTSPSTLAEDGNHPNGAGYDAIAALWLAALRPWID